VIERPSNEQIGTFMQPLSLAKIDSKDDYLDWAKSGRDASFN